MKRKGFLIGISVAAVLALASTAVLLYERAQIATIIDDERAWDIYDAAQAPARDTLPDSTATVAGEDSLVVNR